MRDQIWRGPRGPLVVQFGQYKGRNVSFEELMFRNYGYVRYLRDRLAGDGEWFSVWRHLHWLVEQGENRAVEMECAVRDCERPITTICVKRSGRDHGFNPELTFCSECVKPYWVDSYEIFSPRFSNMLKFRYRADRENFLKLLRFVFVAPEPLTPDSAFRFFNFKPGPRCECGEALELTAADGLHCPNCLFELPSDLAIFALAPEREWDRNPREREVIAVG